jgi:3-oxoadipate enol-lactonase
VPPRRGVLLAAATAAASASCGVVAGGGAPDRESGAAASAPAMPPARGIATTVGRLAVRDVGPADAAGEVIVLWPSILADHRIYGAQIDAWRGRHRVVAIDGPGHGGSGPAPRPFTMAECGLALREVLDALAIVRPVVVVGTSWGGLVAGEFALAQPARTRAAVMLNTPVHVPPDGPGFGDRFVTWGARWIHGTGVYRDGVARAFFLPSTRERGGRVLEDFDRHLRDADGAALARAVRSVLIDREPLAPRMKDIAAPTLFVAGRHDDMYPLEGLRDAAATLPRGRFEVLDTAHISVVDAPGPATALIDAFMASLPPVAEDMRKPG